MADRAVWQRTIVDERGNIIPGAEVTVRSYPGGSLVTLYESPEGAPKSNPFVTGHDGFARFWANSQRVEIVAVGAGSSIRWIVDLLNADEVIGDAVTEATAAAAVAVSEAEAAADRAEAARDAAQLNAGVYEDTAAGLAATTDGDYFSVPSDDSDEYLILYRNESGSATEVQRYPSVNKLRGIEQVDSPLQLPVFDSSGTILSGYRHDGSFRIQKIEATTIDLDGTDVRGGLAEPIESSEYHFALLEGSGEVFAGLGKDARWRTSSLSIGGATADEIEHPVFAWFVAGRDGIILAGLTHDGRWLPGGSGGGGSSPPSTHTVEAVFVEPWLDPSENLLLTWITDSEDAKLMEYRVPGGSNWQAASSIRSRAFPGLPGVYLHTALLLNLSFATVYECRFPGAQGVERFRTTPRRDPKITMISDFQNVHFGEEVPARVLGDDASARGFDLLLNIGDHVNDDGRIDEPRSTRWLSYIKLLGEHYRREGAHVPWVFIIGNHEGRNAAGTSNAETGGDGTLGPMADIFSWSYMPEHPTRFCNSAATFSIGSDVFVISMETDHTEPLAPQIPWVIDEVGRAYDRYKHIVVLGHIPAFYPADGSRHTNAATRTLRNALYPGLEPYADKIVCYGCGHAHVLALTPPLRVAYDESLTPAENDERYTLDEARGIVQIGTGPVQVGYLSGGDALRPPARGDETSGYDGTPMFVAVMGTTGGAPDVRGSDAGAITNVSDNVWHYWLFQFEAGGVTATAYGTHGLPYLTYEKGA